MSRPKRIKAGTGYRGAGGLIYVAECNGLYKVGYSAKVTERMRSLQTANAHTVTLVGTIEGSLSDEAQWHWLLAKSRVRGEWFRLTPDEVALILGMDDVSGLTE